MPRIASCKRDACSSGRHTSKQGSDTKDCKNHEEKAEHKLRLLNEAFLSCMWAPAEHQISSAKEQDWSFKTAQRCIPVLYVGSCEAWTDIRFLPQHGEIGISRLLKDAFLSCRREKVCDAVQEFRMIFQMIRQAESKCSERHVHLGSTGLPP